MENPGLSPVNIAEQNEKGRSVPPGYESIPAIEWLEWSPTNRSSLKDIPWYSSALKNIPLLEVLRERIEKSDYLNLGGRRDTSLSLYFVRPFEKIRGVVGGVLSQGELGERIEKGEYSCILGEDSSGRIPAIFLSETVDKLSEAMNRQKPDLKFYAGFRSSEGPHSSQEEFNQISQELKKKWKEDMVEFVNSLKAGRVLLCTEAISNAVTISNMTEVLKECDRDFDIVSLVEPQTERALEWEKTLPPESKLFTGNLYFDMVDIGIRRNYMMSGVWKKAGDIHARSARREKPSESSLSDQMKRNNEYLSNLLSQEEAMKLSRDLAKYLGANVAQAYLDYKAEKNKA